MKNTKARHLARATRATRKAEKEARERAEFYIAQGRKVPPGRGRHRRWTMAEALQDFVDDSLVQLGITSPERR